MKTAVILSFRGMGVFRADLLRDPRNARLILVVSEREWENVDSAKHDDFHRVHVVPCGVPDAPPLLTSAVEPEAARRVLREILTDTPVTDVSLHCYDELSMMFAAELREEFGLAGPRPADILPFRDKCVMKERLIEAGVRVPKFGRYRADAVDLDGYFDRIAAEVGAPFILKPVDSAGSDGVHLVGSADELSALHGGLTGAHEYEEFITGTMYSVNLISRDLTTLLGGVTEYLVNTMDVRRGKVNADINLIDHDPRVPRMVAFAEQAMEALGWPDGASHLELFHTPDDELVFLEVGARFKGLAGLAAMQRNYAVALANLVLEVESGIASHPYPDEQVYCFDAVIPKRGGVIESLHEPVLASDFDITWKVQPGDRVEDTDSLFNPGGTFLVWNKDYDVLYEDFRRLADYRPISYRAAETR